MISIEYQHQNWLTLELLSWQVICGNSQKLYNNYFGIGELKDYVSAQSF